MRTTEVMMCECSSMEHIIVFEYWSDEPEIYVTVHLTKHKFWKRLKYALRYLFGYQCKYGAFEEVILGTQQYAKIRKMVEHLRVYKYREDLEYVNKELDKLDKG